ncbi:MAG TPA: mannonate dehydratase, partial [Vicinamibacteria bacterium]
MSARLRRRAFLRATGAAALAPAVPPALALSAERAEWPPAEGPGTPRLCLGAGAAADEKEMRRIRQIGVESVLMGGPGIPWKEEDLRALVERFRKGGLAVANLMIGGFPSTLYGRPGRDEEIEKVKDSIRAAGKAGVPVVEYNFYAHRLTEGYYEELGRAGAGLTAYDYDRAKDLPPLPEVGAHRLEAMWANVTY